MTFFYGDDDTYCITAAQMLPTRDFCRILVSFESRNGKNLLQKHNYVNKE